MTGPLVPGSEDPSTQLTTAVVIGCGLTGLAVASELSRRGVDSIVLSGLRGTDGPTLPRHPSGLAERADLLRVLRAYAAGHSLDVRQGTPAEDLGRVHGPGIPAPVPGSVKWSVSTGQGILLADHVVLTSCAQVELRRLIRSLGFTAGGGLKTALRSAGLYLVGVGESLAPTTRELVRQAKRTGEDIALRNRNSVHGLILHPRSA